MSEILRQTMLGLSAAPPTAWTSPWLTFSLLKLFVLWIHAHAAACAIIVDVPANLLQLVALFDPSLAGGGGGGVMAGDAGVCVRGKREEKVCYGDVCVRAFAVIAVIICAGMAAVLFAAVLISTNKETIVFDLLVKRVGLETFAKAHDALLSHAAFVAGEHRAISSSKMVQAEVDAGMQLFDPDSCGIVRAILGKVQAKIYSAALATPSPPSSGNVSDGGAGFASGVKEAAAAAAAAVAAAEAAEAREKEVRAELERERATVECLRSAAAAAAHELQSVREQALKDSEDLKTMLANESLLSRALDEKKRECAQLMEEVKGMKGEVQAAKVGGGVGAVESESAVAGLKEELAAARVGEANAVREQLAATAAAAAAEAARAEAAESLMGLKADHENVRPSLPQKSFNL